VKERRIARCVGEENLVQALESLDEEGFDIPHIIFTGMVPIPSSMGDIIQSQQAVTRVVATYLVIGEKPAGPHGMH